MTASGCWRTSVSMLSGPAQYSLTKVDSRLIVKAQGQWTVKTVASVFEALEADYKASTYETVEFDLTGVEDLDTSGAFLLTKAVRVNNVCKGWTMIDG
ncbi:MAG: STAS domain-containing protein, partial [Pseudomonadota bacterium]